MNEQNKHYWKDGYKDTWAASSSKEELIKKIIEEEVDLTVKHYGLGAGSGEFIAGNANDNNANKGDADLYVESLDAYIEVTGPMIPVQELDALWIRPDKIENTRNKIANGEGSIHAVAHVITKKGTTEKLVRVVLLDDNFYSKTFPTVEPTIRGRRERYKAIPYNSDVIVSLEEFINKLKALKENKDS